MRYSEYTKLSPEGKDAAYRALSPKAQGQLQGEMEALLSQGQAQRRAIFAKCAAKKSIIDEAVVRGITPMQLAEQILGGPAGPADGGSSDDAETNDAIKALRAALGGR